MKVKIVRGLSSDEGTFGLLTTDGGFSCVTGELPWRNNASGKSCIPAGNYRVAMAFSPKHKKDVYHVQAVPGRTVVEIHSANLMGDPDKEYIAQLEGCIALGTTLGLFQAGTSPAGTRDQRGIVNSAAKTAEFEAHCRREPFDLEIVWSEEAK